MASPSGKKEGLRCECEKLLLERDPESGKLGVRCGRDNCRKFHPLDKINQMAVVFEKENGGRKMAEKIIRYRCAICKHEYESEKEALDCEKKGVMEAVCIKGNAAKVIKSGYMGRYDVAVIIKDITIEPVTHRLKYWFDGIDGSQYAVFTRYGELVETKY